VSVTEYFRQQLAARQYVADNAQTAAVERLQRLHDELQIFKSQRIGTINRMFKRPAVPKGVWLYGGVGRGKSFLMDSFYSVINVRRKLRVHFHEFMRGVHRELESLRGTSDPLDEVARKVAAKYRLLCFDEFHISDIADAMILERLLRGLFKHGVILVATSNYKPDGLYPDGLHRDRVLPAIGLLNEGLDVLSVDAGVDYRRRSLEQVQAYLYPNDAQAQASLKKSFDALAEIADEDPVLKIEHREIRALRRAGGVVWFDFATLCGGPRSQNDYLEIASQFHTVILSDIPRMASSMASEARRFVWFIDVMYDQRVKVIMSASCAAEELYTSGAMANEFHRTVSRIVEIQSKEYLEAPRRVVMTSLV
jgi:cell division protein ZapE